MNQKHKPLHMYPSPVYATYWEFAAERLAIFFRRVNQCRPPWTADEILGQYRFTNVYRASDRVSQYLIRSVIYSGDQTCEETFFRIILFKFFNKIETWELLEREVEEISWKSYELDRYAGALTRARKRGHKIYSAAYIMPSGSGDLRCREKHRSHLRLLEMMMRDELPRRVGDAKSMKEVYSLLLAYPMIGPFLAYQLATDINYSAITDFDEMEFVVPGPGARSGIRKCFTELGNMTEVDAIRYVAEHQQEEFEKRGIEFKTLWGRPLQLIDCQNIFCEVDKYARVAHPAVEGIGGRTRIKRKYEPNPEPLDFWFPPKWGINNAVANSKVAAPEPCYAT